MKKAKDITITFILCTAILLLILFSQQAKNGARDGLALCENIIIPSLLPILIISNIIINSRASAVIETIFAPFFEKILKLPRCCAAAVVLGLIGGYPAGAVITRQLYRNALIDNKIAKRIMHFNFCGGVGFIICVIGNVCFNNIKTGAIIYFSNIISSIIICFFDSVFEKDKPQKTNLKKEYLPLGDALIEAVSTTVNSILIMCAYIILFSAAAKIIPLPSCAYALVEITNGICNCKNNIPLDYCSFFVCFGGLCIHFQLFGILREMNIKYLSFFIYRIAGALLSFGITKIFVFCFPQETSVFSNISQIAPKLSTVNTGLSMLMVVGCAVVIFEIENKKIKLP